MISHGTLNYETLFWVGGMLQPLPLREIRELRWVILRPCRGPRGPHATSSVTTSHPHPPSRVRPPPPHQPCVAPSSLQPCVTLSAPTHLRHSLIFLPPPCFSQVACLPWSRPPEQLCGRPAGPAAAAAHGAHAASSG